jgi:uncharacterized DUF497 family protein
MKFEWGSRKAEINLRKHGVSFLEAGTVFGDELAITVPDPNYSKNEDPFITIGWSNRRRLIMLSHTDRGDRIRIISARELTKAERTVYEEEI